MLGRINELFKSKENFAIETTLATKIYKQKIEYAKQNGYQITLLFFWLKNSELAINRVKTRVSEGGHNIPEDVIKRRYLSGIQNLFEIYLDKVDQALIFDNSEGKHDLIAEKYLDNKLVIHKLDKFNDLKKYHDTRREGHSETK